MEILINLSIKKKKKNGGCFFYWIRLSTKYYFIKPVHSFNIFQLSHATSDLLKAINIW